MVFSSDLVLITNLVIVTLFCVINSTRLPVGGLCSPFIHFSNNSAICSNGVHVEVSHFAIHFLLKSVSNILGRIAMATLLSGMPASLHPKDSVNAWTATFDILYPIMFGPLVRADFDPVKANNPPGLRNLLDIEAEIVEGHTDCFQVVSACLDKFLAALPPAQPPATQSTALSWK